MTPPLHRFHELDLLRGLACAAVVFFHFFSRAPRADWISHASYPSIDLVARYGYLGVHLFFVISGFVILMSAHGATPRAFVASRVARLYPALWVAATITASAAWLLAEPRYIISLPDYLVNLTMLARWFEAPYVDGAYWSLTVELHFYIYVWITLRLKKMHRLEWLLMAWLAVSALNVLRPAWPVEFWLNAKWAPLFVAGGTFFLIRTRGLTLFRSLLLLTSWVLALHYALLAIEADPRLNPWVVVGVINAIFAIFLAIAFDLWRMASARLSQLAGALTYPVYVVHQFFGFMVYERLRAVIDNTPIAIALTMLLVVLISWVIHRYVEKTTGPWLRKLIAGNPIKSD